VRERISQGSRKILVVLPTGGGKSVVSARIMQLAAEKGRESIFFAAQRELVSQIGNQLARISIPSRTVMAGVKNEYTSFEDHAEARCTLIARDTLWQRAFRRSKMELPPADIMQIDECLTGDALVQTPSGKKRLDTVRPGDVVLSRLGEYNVWRPVTAFMDKGPRQTLVIKTQCGEIQCTHEHPVYTQRGWQKAGNLETTDFLLSVGVDAERDYSGTQHRGCRRTSEVTPAERLVNNGSSLTRSTLKLHRFVDVDVANELSPSSERLSNSSRLKGRKITQDLLLGMAAGNSIHHSFWMIGKRGSSLRWYMETDHSAYHTPGLSTTGCALVMDGSRGSGLNARLQNFLDLDLESKKFQTEDTGMSFVLHRPTACLNSTSSSTYARETAGSSSPEKVSNFLTMRHFHGGSATMARRGETQERFTSKDALQRSATRSRNGFVVDMETQPSLSTVDTDDSVLELNRTGTCASELESTFLSQCSTKWVPIRSIEDGPAENVYDITVEESHCFYANGLLVHNCHQAGCPTYTKIMQAYDKSIIIGFTATPCRTDNKPLGLWFDSMVMGASYSELQALGFLVPVKVIAPNRPDLKGCKVSKGDYNSKDLQQRMNRDQMVGDIVSEWVTHGQGRSTVLFASGVDHSIHCRDEFRKKGISSEHIDGTMPTEERDDIMQRARDGKITVICNFGVLHTGVDVPQWKVMICARPTKSFQLWRQMGGRVQRPYPGHDHCLLLDHSDNSLVFGYPDEDVDWDIDGDADQGKKHMEAKKREKGEKSSDPYHCEKCRAVYRGYSCPNCGHKPERRGKEIEMSREKLVELERKKLNRKSTPMEKQKHWDDCMGIAIHKNLKIGAAAHMYKSKFGVFPVGLQNMPRASQWQMKAKDFYTNVVKPEKVSRDSQQWLEEVTK
jgi:DNA repair protein RadD